MKRRVSFLALLALFAAPALAADKPLDLGFARPGMSVEDFRTYGWPQGVMVRCSGEDDLPPVSDIIRLDVPGPVAQLGGLRCGLFSHAGESWQPFPLQVGAKASEVWGKFFPDRDGSPRLLQLIVKQPRDGFDALVDHFTERFGPPGSRAKGLARWQAEGAEATIIDDGGQKLLAVLIDTRLQAVLNARMSQQPRRPVQPR